MALPDPFGLAAGFALVLVALILGFLILTTYNDVVALRNRIDTAWSNIDVALKQRHDQLPALVDAVRGALAFERGTLENVARLRAAYQPQAPIPDQAATSEATSAAVRSLFAVVENYPELRSTSNVLELQAGIERLEDTIAARRELYNDQVFRYNTRIGQVPGVIVASLFGWTIRPFFRTDPGETGTVLTSLG
ncbi:MAG TPA: LemA family protein [Candidatus Polarisedimenticolia bacterium]|nr:LemA family protein [Candidatus Polarisedimenticolia bacterium]